MLATKPGVRFFDPILNAIQIASEQLGFDLIITSGTDGTHSGLSDPHHSGRAYDVRSHDLASKDGVLLTIMLALNDGPLLPGDGGIVTEHFFGWLENVGQDDEHFHIQVRRGVSL